MTSHVRARMHYKCCASINSRPLEYVAEFGVLRALRIELTPGVGLCGTQPVVGPALRALSCGGGVYLYTCLETRAGCRCMYVL